MLASGFSTEMSVSKKSQFDELVAEVQRCELCPRMGSRTKVLSYHNGSLNSPVVFVAEAPGRFGADKYGIPLYGDRTGRNFESFLAAASLDRQSVFVTNAVLCNPRSQNGTNDPPNESEVRNCSEFLRRTLEVIRPLYIVTLGTKALYALKILHHHELTLAVNVGRLNAWNGCKIYPLYHPSPRALIRRSWDQQHSDYRELGSLLRISSEDYK